MLRKLFFVISIFLLLNYTGTAQTRLIAYQSHSGDMSYFKLTSEDNLGLPDFPPRLDSIAKINDSTIVHYYNSFYGNKTVKDTIINNPIWLVANLDLDSIKAERGEHIHFIGFDTEPTSQPIKIIPKKKRFNKKRKKSCAINDNTQSQLIPGGGSNGNSPPPSSKIRYLIFGLFLFSSILFFYYSQQEKSASKIN